ncbi:Os11g0209550, partial [Oryza sativa Japonica Group]
MELFHTVAFGDAQARGGLPEVAPAPCEQARPHGVRRRQEPEDVVEDPIRKASNPILVGAAASRWGSLNPFPRLPWTHSVEQVAGVAFAEQE